MAHDNLPESSSASHAARSNNPRADIQVLRGVAVLLVVAFHFAPKQVTGGFVGVDAFLAISGYLITAHLWKELSSTGSVRLAEFWARRARRLLPAAFLVLLVTLLGTLLIAPTMEWGRTARDVSAAALYFYNFVLAEEATDYFAEDQSPSPVQHFWSLCVEEQFYLLWPLLLTFLAKRGKRRAWTLGATATLFALSLAASIVLSPRYPPASYFLLPTRMWEFLVGGAIALLRITWPARLPALVPRAVGFAAVILTGLLLDSDVPFPGWIAAIPVFGAACVLTPHATERDGLSSPLFRPLVFLGDISYSVYLWHWPLLILLKNYFGAELEGHHLLALTAVTLVLATTSKFLVEDPLRFAAVFSLPYRSFAAALLAMATVAGSALALGAHHDSLVQDSKQRVALVLASGAPCLGALARASSEPCINSALDGTLIPSPTEAAQDAFRDCGQRNGSSELLTCTVGDTDSDLTVALIGDSHAGHLIPGLASAAKKAGIKIVTYIKGGCPLTRSPRKGPLREGSECETWKGRVRKRLKEDKSIDAVMMIGNARAIVSAAHKRNVEYEMLLKQATNNYVKELDKLPKHIRQAIIIRDTPGSNASALPCIERLGSADDRVAQECSIPASEALPPDPLVLAAERRPSFARVVDLSHTFCDAMSCLPVVGHVLVYRDTTHLTATFAKTLSPLFEQHLHKLKPLLAEGKGKGARSR